MTDAARAASKNRNGEDHRMRALVARLAVALCIVIGLAGLALTAYVLDTNKPAITSLRDFGPQDKIALPASNSPQAILLQMAAEKVFGDYKKLDANFVSLPHPDA